MDYSDLKEITQTIITILEPEVTCDVLPEILRNDDTGLGLYLYHVQENASFKNLPSPGIDMPPIKYSPLALNLYYQLSANWRNAAGKQDALEEQAIMSAAMKVLHEHAIITRTIPGNKKIHAKISLQNLSTSESIQYWAAAESPVRLSAYYEISVVLIEPEKPTSYAGRVLQYGNYVFVKGNPQITQSQSIINYRIPSESQDRTVQISPAQAPPATTLPGVANNRFKLKGNGFVSANWQLLIHHPLWPEAAVASPLDWALVKTADHTIDATLRETATLIQAGTPVVLVPGIYQAQVVNIETRLLPNGLSKTFRHSSNLFPFSVTPRIDTITPLSGLAGSSFTIQGFVFQHADLDDSTVEVLLGASSLNRRAALVALTPGDYRVDNPNQITFRAPASISAGLAALRIIVGGVESTPNWVTIL